MPNKKILLMCTRGDIGGVQVFLHQTARVLKAKGLNVAVAAGPGDYLPGVLRPDKVPFRLLASLKRTGNPLKHLRFILEAKRLFEREGFGAVHLNSSNTLLATISARLSKPRPKVVFTVHGLSVLDPEYRRTRALKPLYRLYFKLLLPLCDEVVYISRRNLDIARGLGLASGRERLILNGLDIRQEDFLLPEEARRELTGLCGTDCGNCFLLGFVGRLTYQKNLEFLLKVFPHIIRLSPTAQFVAIGEGEERAAYEGLIRRYGYRNKIRLIGELPRAYRFIRAFDCFVLPARYEGMSLTLIEAIFAGVPILATRVGGNAEVLGGSEEQLFGLNDEADFLAKLKAIVNDEGLRKRLGEENKARSKEFSIERMVEGYLKIY